MKNVRYFTMLQESRQRNGSYTYTFLQWMFNDFTGFYSYFDEWLVSNPCMHNVCSDVCTLSPTGPKCLSYNENHSSLHDNLQARTYRFFLDLLLRSFFFLINNLLSISFSATTKTWVYVKFQHCICLFCYYKYDCIIRILWVSLF